ncbi:MAG: hypothetical protein ACYC3G_04550 [Minisyncoccota bacterium]
MEYTEGQKEKFKRDFAGKRRRQLLIAIPLIVAVVLIRLLKDKGDETFIGLPPTIIFPVSLIIVAAALIYSIINWRCPACNKYLGKHISPSYCSKCGVPLK